MSIFDFIIDRIFYFLNTVDIPNLMRKLGGFDA